ncbi:MAG: dephospho-CoA kinase, partial [Anaerolineaceae bacterium]|nr:dephospho-CoA kinase [Anaerolineaceae bacterium]
MIGLTGNIGTGKSVVRRMLEHLGALGIDADALAHRAIAKGAPGYKPVIQAFGRWVVGPDGEIDRGRLGRLVFSDPQGLAQLEAIVHPLVLQAVDWMIGRSTRTVAVVEAIKLLEVNLNKSCDSIWVVTAPADVQLSRLVQKRKINETDARQRIQAQPPQQAKIARANVLISNTGSFEDTWKQVSAAWIKNVPQPEPTPAKETQAQVNELTVTRARPRDSALIAELFNRVKKETRVSGDEIMAEFGDKAFLLLRTGGRVVGAAGWQVENLVARTTEIIIDPRISANQALPILVTEMERASKDLQ